MRVSFADFQLEFNEPFVLSKGTRTHTQGLFLKLEHEGRVGYGEVTVPPYLGLDLNRIRQEATGVLKDHGEYVSRPVALNELLNQKGTFSFVQSLVIMAVVNLNGHVLNDLPAGRKKGLRSFTITYSNYQSDTIPEAARNFDVIKLKVGTRTPMEEKGFIQWAMKRTGKPFYVDANGGWNELNEAIDFSRFLEDCGCLAIEEPFHFEHVKLITALKERTTVPVAADESIQNIREYRERKDHFAVVNVKLPKCGGLMNALDLATAISKDGKVGILGCMSESSLACGMAFSLRHHFDYVDLDAPWLIANDPFFGYRENVEGEIDIRLREDSGLVFEPVL